MFRSLDRTLPSSIVETHTISCTVLSLIPSRWINPYVFMFRSLDGDTSFIYSRNTYYKLHTGKSHGGSTSMSPCSDPWMTTFPSSVRKKMWNLLLFLDFCGEKSPFCGAPSTLCFGLWLTLPMGFKAKVDASLSPVCNGTPESTLTVQDRAWLDFFYLSMVRL